MSQQVAAQRGGSSPFPCDGSCATLNFVSAESGLYLDSIKGTKEKFLAPFLFFLFPPG